MLKPGDYCLYDSKHICKVLSKPMKDSFIRLEYLVDLPDYVIYRWNKSSIINVSVHRCKPYKPTIKELFLIKKAQDEYIDLPF